MNAGMEATGQRSRHRQVGPTLLAAVAAAMLVVQAIDPATTRWLGHPLVAALLIGLLAVALLHARRTRRSAGRARAALAQTEDRLRRLVSRAPILMWTLDGEGRFVAIAGKGMERIGFDAEALVGRRAADALGSNSEMVAFLRRGLGGEEFHAVVQWSHATFDTHFVPERDGDGQPCGLFVVATDVTDRRKLEDSLRQAQKMEAVGRLAGAIAHDFNNLLTVMTGYTDLVLHGLEESHPARSDVVEIQRACARAAAVTSQLLAFSRKQPASQQVLDLNRTIAEMSEILRRLVGVNVETVLRYDQNIGPIKADRVQIEQILMNLSVNARDAMRDGGRLSIETDAVELDETFASHFVDLRAGRYVLLTVSDTGCGMDENTRAHLFEPFFTTKPKGKGTGLGLATVYGAVQQSRGSISVESALGEGTTFRIYLPVVDEELRGDTPHAIPTGSSHGTETVLLAEDNEHLRRMARVVLEEHGYRVLTAIDGADALAVASAASAPIDILVSDVSMPRLSGPELARALRTRDPHLPVLLMSGFPDTQLPADLPGTQLIDKPFTTSFLARKVRQTLDARSTEAASASSHPPAAPAERS
jgi:PAS domain S-box-containing protein